MNARFAELCRSQHLELVDVEGPISRAAQEDGRTERDRLLNCDKDIYIGVFFDGTNNNKYRDTPGLSQSNIARLYEVYPGTPASQTPPVLRPRILPDGTKNDRTPFSDLPFKSDSVQAADFPYYRKIYIPGLGTPMPDVGDSSSNILRTGGLAFAFLGQVRLAWAQLQLVNQIHAAIFGAPLEGSIDTTRIWRESTERIRRLNPVIDLALSGSQAALALFEETRADLMAAAASFNTAALDAAMNRLQDRLEAALKQRGSNKPHLRKIRLSVFGFSRGAAAARAWTNLVVNRWGSALAGIPLQIDFLGLFDSVASVGFTPAMPRLPGLRSFEGHAMWAGHEYMPVPASVRRCAHLVAALEVRGSFPLDSVSQGNALPPNCKEIVYPGVHSDVGGGYAPDDQGRALGRGAAGDAFKISQIPLAQMYREARMAGVPLAAPGAMRADKQAIFAIAPQLRDDFNAYVAATRNGSVPPTEGKGEPTFGRMYPTETQPREELFRVIRRHYGFTLRWRKALLNRPGGIAGLDGPLKARSETRYQDIEDLRGAEKDLVKEILFLQKADSEKFKVLDDPLAAGNWGQVLPVIGGLACWVYLKAFPELMIEKQREWDTWLQHEWASHDSGALPEAAVTLFERYVHDSRAWFKPMLRSDGRGLSPDDEDWFVYGGRETELGKRRASSARAARQGVGLERTQGETELRVLAQEGQPLIPGGREPYQMWGYLRHRAIYQCGKRIESTSGALQHRIESEESERLRQRSRAERTAAEDARHKAEVDKLMVRNHEVIRENRLQGSQLKEFTDGTRMQIEGENRLHQEQLNAIHRETSPS